MKKTALFVLIAIMLVAAVVLAVTFLPAVLEDRKLTVGVTNTSAVLCYQNPNGEWGGLQCDSIRAMAEEIGYTVEFKEITWTERDTLLKNGDIDCYIDGQEHYGSENLTTDVLFYSTQTLIYKSGLESANIGTDSLKILSVAVQNGSFNYNYLLSLGAESINEYNSVSDVMVAVKSGSSVIGIIDYGLYLAYMKGSANYADIVSGILTDDCGYRLVFGAKDSERVEKINGGIATIKENDTINDIIDQYTITTEHPFLVY